MIAGTLGIFLGFEDLVKFWPTVKCCNKKNNMKVDKNTGEIRKEKILYHLVSTFFPKNLKSWHQKIGFGKGHQDIGQKL